MDPYATAVVVPGLPLTPITATPAPEDDRSSPTDSQVSSESPQGFYSYDLRPSARDGKTVFITWWDVDQSGDYDPAKKGKQPKGKERKRLVPSKRPHDDTTQERVPPKALKLSKLAAKQKGCSMVCTLILKSKECRALAAQIPDNWPTEDHNVLSDEYIKKIADELGKSSDRESCSVTKSYILRDRAGPQTQSQGLQAKIPDPAGIESDLHGHPAARGCVACRMIGMHCPLLDDNSTWPCHVCTEDNCDCELITPPLRKLTCESCRRKMLPCSYVYEKSDATQSCTQCVESQAHCVAGPASGAIRERIGYDRDYSKPWQQVQQDPQAAQRRYVTCTACRANKISCSLRKKTDSPPCKSCINAGIACTFQAVPRKPTTRTFTPVTKAATDESGELRKVSSATASLPPNAEVIRTSLCHPIKFQVEDQSQCHWCQNPSYGILGLGEREVVATLSSDKAYYTELRGGHIEQGQQNSRMCIICSMSRVRIIGCPKEHEMRPLDNIIEDIDIESSFQRLVSNTLRSTDRWCALCPSLAIYQCCTPQETDMWGAPIDPASDDAEGCGLLLCEDCAVVLGELEGNLDALIDVVGNADGSEGEGIGIWAMGARADAQFLRQEGLLVSSVFAGVAEGETEDVDE